MSRESITRNAKTIPDKSQHESKLSNTARFSLTLTFKYNMWLTLI